MKFFLASTSIVAACAKSTQEEDVNRINSVQSLWKAGYPAKFQNQARGSYIKDLCGVKDHDETGSVLKKRANDPNDELFQMGPLYTGGNLPANFDSAENWPQCAKIIDDIRDQSHCGCCWAFGAASVASDRACISTNATISLPLSAQDTCFNSQPNGCGGGGLDTPFQYFHDTGVVTGTQQLDDISDEASDPFDGANLCSAFSLPHCHHHGPIKDGDPYPSEGDENCPDGMESPDPFDQCDSNAVSPHADFASDKVGFTGTVFHYPFDVDTIKNAIMTGGPVETAMTVYADFEDYTEGIYNATTDEVIGGHAVRIVGWGTDEESGVEFWKVANSWNIFWGEKGFIRIVSGINLGGLEQNIVASSADAVWGYMKDLQ